MKIVSAVLADDLNSLTLLSIRIQLDWILVCSFEIHDQKSQSIWFHQNNIHLHSLTLTFFSFKLSVFLPWTGIFLRKSQFVWKEWKINTGINMCQFVYNVHAYEVAVEREVRVVQSFPEFRSSFSHIFHAFNQEFYCSC